MNLVTLALTFGLLTGLVIGFLVGAYLTLRDHGDLIDDGLAFRALVVDLASRPTSAGTTRVGDVRGEARIAHLRVVNNQ